MKSIKRILSLVLALTLCLGLFVLPANAATADQNTKAKALWTLGLSKGFT